MASKALRTAAIAAGWSYLPFSRGSRAEPNTRSAPKAESLTRWSYSEQADDEQPFFQPATGQSTLTGRAQSHRLGIGSVRPQCNLQSTLQRAGPHHVRCGCAWEPSSSLCLLWFGSRRLRLPGGALLTASAPVCVWFVCLLTALQNSAAAVEEDDDKQKMTRRRSNRSQEQHN